MQLLTLQKISQVLSICFSKRINGIISEVQYIFFFFVSCFDIWEVPRSPGKWNWNWLYFFPFIFTFEQCVMEAPRSLNMAECGVLNHKREQAHKKRPQLGLKNAYWKWVDSIIGFFSTRTQWYQNPVVLKLIHFCSHMIIFVLKVLKGYFSIVDCFDSKLSHK